MSNLLWKSLVVSPAVLGAALLVSGTAIASPAAGNSASNAATEVSILETQAATEVVQQPVVLAQVKQDTQVLDQVKRYSNEGQNLQSQVTSVSQFSDVQPTDWAFQALQSLVERYGCIAGYPNGTYRGNRALTRYEFAAGLNACLDRVNELIATATADMVTKQDLATLQRLQEEFSAELATLRGRVDALEARTAELEANQFSTTTKLQGEAIFALTDAFNGDIAGKTVFQDRVRLNLQSSFTGRDMLNTRLAAGNAQNFGNTGESRQTFDVGSTGTNNVVLDKLTYEAPVGPAQVYIAATGGKHSHYAAVNNPYFFDKTDGGNGALSTFSSENPIYRIGGGSGIALNVPFGQGGGILKPSSLTLGYLASEANSPAAGEGLFDGNYAALGQLNFNVGNRIALAATYVHGYHGASSRLFDSGEGDDIVGTSLANNLSLGSASSSNSYGVSAAFRPSDKLSVSGFVSYHDITGFGAGDDYEAWSYGVGVALPDFGKKGNVLGIFGGAQPYSFNNNGGANSGDIPYQVEGFYKYRVSDNISVTPGVIWLPSIGQSSSSEDTFIGTLRTTFTF
ncbi:iron uptake porin [Anabaena cylindrica FACHB-243]|uniref:Cyanobacterial porin n=1 Tax=Anabaena cylindrica (strain ATCC 27899 / PCC 7122) TaxID=272123 RepID=K9ZHZ6_ANACC|nr:MULTISPECIES: iron uptake porin [Anabaena]AFZ58858.1 cyanobacterial porin [Anabaena cylindrica PCC 7122]MBD2419443.1 iron uptake porin [Anabaena cylindrica FACHB-243]MBY5283810.1 iron uptake porin [Anabaena sp. CCAP 1446/1C]MBY5306216.1 iron uptake porin [Anabaena sp. CCAP 1446/1C]MCM2408374.1 iron uptake porin [Anabaena sp. CCAP 1446/1C]